MNIKSIKTTTANIGLLVIFLLITKVNLFATTFYSIASGPWTTSSTWSLSSSGTAILSGYPGVGDNVIIEGGYTVTIAASGVENLSAANVTIGSTTAGTLYYPSIYTDCNLTISGDLTIGGTSAAGTLNYNYYGLTITCNRLLKGVGNATRVNAIQQDFTFTGTFTLYSGFNQFRNFIIGPLANVTLGSNIETNGSISPNINLGGTLNMQNYNMDIGGYKNFYIYGTLILSGNSGGFGSNNFPNNFETLVIGSSSTVVYSFAGSQTIYPSTYANLTLSGSGTKTIGTNGYVSSITINNGGSGYDCGVNLDFSNGSGSGASASASISGGVITSVSVNNGGSGYTSSFPINTEANCDGSGGNLTANISYANTIIVNGVLNVTNCSFSTGTGNLSLGSSASAIINATASLNIGGGTTNFNNRPVTLKSDATGTAAIGTIVGTLSNATNVTVERYIPGLSSKRYRFLSTAVATNVADWRGEIFITGGGVSSEFTSVGLNNIKSNGLDWTLSGSPSMYGYTENLNSGSLNSRWEAITSGSTTLTIGKGYRVFIRGDRTNAGVLDNSVASQSSVIISSTGTLNQGSKTLPATYNGATANDGWNLVGNPYPSTIDWNASSGWTKTNVSPTIWIYNPSNNSYGNWDGSTVTNSVTRYISSGQAFFVRTTGTPTFSCTEAVKTNTAGAAIFKTNPENTLRIGLTKNETNSDETVIRFMDGRNNEFSDDDDVRKFINSSVNVSSNFGVDKYASVNYLDPKSVTDKVVQISAWVDSNGTYKLTFDGVNSFNSTPYVSLRDKFLNKLVDLRTTNTYQFDITNDSNSKNDNRFEVVFADKTSSLNENNLITSTYLNIYPNPAFDLLNINISSSFKNSDVVIYNISGMEVLKTNMAANNAHINIETLSNGIYFIKVSNQNGFVKTVKFVK